MTHSSVLRLYLSSGSEPDYTALWIALAIIGTALFLSTFIFFYNRWEKKNHFTITIIGRTIHVPKNTTIDLVYVDSIPLLRWASIQCGKQYGYIYHGLYLDPLLTIPLNENRSVSKPLTLYPKLTKR